MVRRILRNKKFLEYYLEADKKSRKHLLKGANKDQVDSLCEATLNIVKKNIPVDSNTKAVLCKHKHIIQDLTIKKKPLHKRKRLLVQKGGAFLPIILGTILPLIAEAIFKK